MLRHRVVDLPRRARRRGQRQDDHRRVGRVRLAVGRVAAQRGRQVGARGVDRGLHLARGAVDLAVQVELQADARRAVAAGRGHLVDAGDRCRAAAPAASRRWSPWSRGSRRAGCADDRDRREVDLRQRRHRQHEERRDAGQRDADGQQHRRDRAGGRRARRGSCRRHALGACALAAAPSAAPSRSKAR